MKSGALLRDCDPSEEVAGRCLFWKELGLSLAQCLRQHIRTRLECSTYLDGRNNGGVLKTYCLPTHVNSLRLLATLFVARSNRRIP